MELSKSVNESLIVSGESAYLADLHRHIRLSQWHGIMPIIEKSRNGTNLSILLSPNKIGWTALHFASLHGTPSLSWWIWLLIRVKEEHLSETVLGINRGNPFHARTSAGYSPIDLYFSKSLHPFPWELYDVVRKAYRLRRTIGTMLSLPADHELLAEMKQRIRFMMDEEQLRLSRGRLGYDDVHSSCIWENYICYETFIDMYAQNRLYQPHHELEQEMASNDHVTETGDDEYLPWDEEIQLSESEKLNFINFWHHMELLILMTTKLRLRLNDSDYINHVEGDSTEKHWNILHALAWTGAPDEISKLAIKFYPLDSQYRDENGNLPLHIACYSHRTSSLADGTWNRNRPRTLYDDDRKSCIPNMITQLLQTFPRAAEKQNDKGSYPLNLALMVGKTWNNGISSLFLAFPMATLSLDPVIRMPSFLIAATTRTYHDYGVQSNSVDVCMTDLDLELWAKRCANNKLGCTWGLLPEVCKKKAIQQAKRDIEIIKTTTIYQLLRLMPGSINCFCFGQT